MRAGKRICGLTERTSRPLQTYDWPGNIRELQNVIERSVIVSDSETLLITLFVTGLKGSTATGSPLSPSTK